MAALSKQLCVSFPKVQIRTFYLSFGGSLSVGLRKEDAVPALQVFPKQKVIVLRHSLFLYTFHNKLEDTGTGDLNATLGVNQRGMPGRLIGRTGGEAVHTHIVTQAVACWCEGEF